MSIVRCTKHNSSKGTVEVSDVFDLGFSVRSGEKSEDVYEEGVLIASFFGPLAEKRAILFLNAEMMD